MLIQQPTAAPDRFVRLLNKTIEERDLTLREVARRVGVSITYLSRLLHKERGLPADKTITKFERVLEMPSGTLFDAARRHDELAAKVFKNDKARRLLRSLEPLSDDEFAKVVAEAERLAKKYHPEES
ncbi:MAG: helix-turn-helix domain-containing protein [Limisphaerales bacterium]